MKILTINAGSSSMKFCVMEVPENQELINGYFERIGSNDSFYTIKFNGEKKKIEKELKNHIDALECIKTDLLDLGIVSSLDEIDAVGHRVVHGGEDFASSVIIDDKVIESVKKVSPLAPLHNPANIACIEACMSVFPGKPMVAVFDTSFHQTMDKVNYLYPIPYEWYQKYGVRKYGFHGTSHKFINREITKFLDNDKLKVISCHIGSGASVCAIDAGKVVDTSMGFSPMTGIMMGTRPGDIDPSIVTYMAEVSDMDIKEVMNMLNKHSGLEGICGHNDSRDVEDGIAAGDEQCILAQKMFERRVANYIAMYNNLLNGADVICLTAGLGENSAMTRKGILDLLSYEGIFIDEERNDFRGEFRLISTDDSKIPVYVVPTNEELMIALDTYELVR